jgi:hypothetical protein
LQGGSKCHNSPATPKEEREGLVTESGAANSGGFIERARQTVLHAIDVAVKKRWQPAQDRAAATTGPTRERINQVRKMFVRELTTIGTVSGGAAAAPGLGSAAKAGTTIVELGWITTRFADVILTIAAIHGHTRASLEERRAWILTILAYGDTAGAIFTGLARESGIGLGLKATRSIPMSTLRKFNHAMGRTIVQKYGTKRGVVTLGQFLPFGIGAVIGGAGNYITVRMLVRQSDRFFAHLPPPIVAEE